MKFIKAPITECLHSIIEQVDSMRKWGHTWFLDDDGQVDRVRTSTGVLLSVGDKVTDFWDDPCHIESFDPEDDSAYLINEEGGENTDYSIEDIVEMIKKSVRKTKKATIPENKECVKENAEESKVYRVTYDVGDNIFSAVMVEANSEKEAEKIFIKARPDKKDKIIGIREQDGLEVASNKKKGMSLIKEDMEPIEVNGIDLSGDNGFKGTQLEETSSEDKLFIKIKEEDLQNLPDWLDDKHWYVSRYNIDFEKIPDTPFYKVIADNRKDIGRFVHDFDLDDKVLVGNFLESVSKEELKEEKEEMPIYKITVKEKDAQDLFSSFMVRANSEEEAKQLYQDKYAAYGELVGIRDVSDYEVNEFKRRGMKLYEDVEENEEVPAPPIVGEESAAASIINSLIRDEWVAIDQYNSAMANFKEMKIGDKIIEVLNHIMIDENTHVGNLQEVLALLAPATDKIEKGNEQAEEILGTENNEVGV